MKPIRLMLIGLGRWSRFWNADIQNNKLYKITALVGRRPLVNIREVASEFGLRESVAFNDLEAAIQQTKPAAALILVPPAEHYAVAMMCIAEGIHVISEKPLANSMAEALELYQATLQRNLQFMVAQDYRWQPP